MKDPYRPWNILQSLIRADGETRATNQEYLDHNHVYPPSYFYGSILEESTEVAKEASVMTRIHEMQRAALEGREPVLMETPKDAHETLTQLLKEFIDLSQMLAEALKREPMVDELTDRQIYMFAKTYANHKMMRTLGKEPRGQEPSLF